MKKYARPKEAPSIDSLLCLITGDPIAHKKLSADARVRTLDDMRKHVWPIAQRVLASWGHDVSVMELLAKEEKLRAYWVAIHVTHGATQLVEVPEPYKTTDQLAAEKLAPPAQSPDS